jgi:chaperonin GroES
MQPPQPEMEDEGYERQEARDDYGQDGVSVALNKALYSVNLAEDMDEEELKELGEFAKVGYEADKGSRKDWEEEYDKALKQAMQVVEPRTYPWPKASNIKFPIIAIAAMQFSARAYPTLVPSDRQVVKQKIIGYDAQGEKALKAEGLGMFMSWQLMDKMRRWEEDMDRLLLALPIVGTVFKKTYWDTLRNVPCSEMVHALDLVVNYWATDLESAERKTQEYRYTKRQIEEQQRAKVFLDVDLPAINSSLLKTEDELSGMKAPSVEGADTPYLVLEQHTFYDVDGDDYPEPVVVTFFADNGQVLRVTARWEADGIKVDDDGKLIRIEPCEYYTKFGMFPNPDGGFYDVGFGRVLGSLNDAVDSIINNLVDAGHLANLQGGWISKGLKMKQGDQPFRPGEWRAVNATLDDIKKGLAPHMYKEPSSVLFQLLGMLIGVSKELASVSELMTGKMPGQNTPAYTTKEAAEQGMKVFTAVYKRVFRALAEEFRKLHRLNKIYVAPDEIQRVLDAPVPVDHTKVPDDDIIPAADPNAVSASTKSAKARIFQEMIQAGAINRQAGMKKIMELEEIPLTPDLLQPPEPPPPDPKVQMEQKKLEAEMQMMQQEHQFKMEEMKLELQMKQEEFQLEKQKAEFELQIAQARLDLEMKKMGVQVQKAQVDMQVNERQSQMDMAHQTMQHQMDIEQSQTQHDLKLTQMKEAASAKNKQAGSSGLASQRNDGGSAGKNQK